MLSRLVRNSGVILGSFPNPYRSHTTTGSLITSERLTVSIEVFVIQREHYNKKRGKCQPAKVPKSVGFYRFGRAWRYKTEGICAEHALFYYWHANKPVKALLNGTISFNHFDETGLYVPEPSPRWGWPRSAG